MKSKITNIKKPQFIYDQTFRQNYYVSYGVSQKYWQKQVKKFLNIDTEINEDAGGRTVEFITNQGNVTWIWTQTKDISILSHEVLHAIFFTLSNRNTFLEENTQEIFCYQVQMLIRLILENNKRK